MKELIYVLKTIWKFLTTDPKERADEEWEDIFIVGEALRRTRKMSEHRKNNRSIYGTKRIYKKRRHR